MRALSPTLAAWRIVSELVAKQHWSPSNTRHRDIDCGHLCGYIARACKPRAGETGQTGAEGVKAPQTLRQKDPRDWALWRVGSLARASPKV